MRRSLFLALIVREWRHHPWRHGVALLAVALGVALACSVHLINSSALSEFSAAVRAANGEPDLTLRGPRAGFDDAVFERVAADPGVELASPVLEIDTYATAPGGERVAVRVLGIDALLAAPLAPALCRDRRQASTGSPSWIPMRPSPTPRRASSSAWPTAPGSHLQRGPPAGSACAWPARWRPAACRWW